MAGDRPADLGRCRPNPSPRDHHRDTRRRLEVLRTCVPGPAGWRGRPLSRRIQPGPEFGQLFADFEHTAFRLEVRSRYAPAYEGESLQRFLAG
ncbi:MAG TPA: hypothetical protein VJX10_17660, partial [Pseudonocardiaceae bacterium]|nr:hypothetical protein [Pseudonocardiaceae bacterium]